MTPIVDSHLVTLYDPTTRPASVLGLEVIVLGLAALTFVHAWRAHRRGDRAALLTWITIVVYGLAMEIISYNLVDNFAHAQFTVMFYDRQLPLYVTAVYPVLLYTGIATARGLGLPRYAEALAAGALIVAMDAPFDVCGPVAGWWRWYDTDPNIAYRWLGVPVTSYYWHFAFGGILALVTGWAAARWRPSPWLALPLSAVVIVLGMLAFAPFHLLKAIGVADGVIVAAALAIAALIAITAPRAPIRRDALIVAAWLTFWGYHLVVAACLHGATWWPPRLAFVGAIATGALLIASGVLRRRPTVARPA